MLITAITYEFAREDADEAERLFEALMEESRKEPGCHGFDVARAIGTPHVFCLYEKWHDDAALEAHFASPHFQKYGVNGIRQLATSRTAYTCRPLSP